MFPVKFVEIIEDLPQQTEPEPQVCFTEFSFLLTFYFQLIKGRLSDSVRRSLAPGFIFRVILSL